MALARCALLVRLTALFFAAPGLAQDRSSLIEQGKQLFFKQGCYGCHTVGKVGTPIGAEPERRTRSREQGQEIAPAIGFEQYARGDLCIGPL